VELADGLPVPLGVVHQHKVLVPEEGLVRLDPAEDVVDPRIAL
jgi:hypothetical protein